MVRNMRRTSSTNNTAPQALKEQCVRLMEPFWEKWNIKQWVPYLLKERVRFTVSECI